MKAEHSYTPQPERKLITTADAMKIAGGVSRPTFWRWRQTVEDFPPIVTINGRNYVWEHEWLSFLKSKEAA